MTTMYTIGIIILSLAFILSLLNIIEMIEGKSKIWILPILVVGGILLVLCAIHQPRLDKYYEVENPHSYQVLFPNAYTEGYNNGKEDGYLEGYEAAIKDAVLVETTDT